MTSFEIALLIFLIFICIYTIIDRICKCIEHKHMSDVFEEFMNKNKDINEISDSE